MSGSEFEGRTALVTGGGRGIGRAISLELARCGARVVVNYRADAVAAERTVRDIAAIGGEAIAVAADVSRPEDVERLVGSARDRFGGIHYLVNNAAYLKMTPPDRLTYQEFMRMLTVDVGGPFLLTWAVKDEMLADGGSIVNIGSCAGSRPNPNHIHYCTAKAGLEMLTKAIALALAPKVRVNCVAPGLVMTDPAKAMPERFLAEAAGRIALGRGAEPGEIARVVRFVLSEEASYLTGEVIHVDGGVKFLSR